MPRHQLLVLSNPAPGQEDAYHEWYTHTHLRDVLELPGFTAAQRFSLDATPAGGSAMPRFAAIYEFETDDVEALFAQLAGRFGEDPDTQRLLDFDSLQTLVLTPITERRTAD